MHEGEILGLAGQSGSGKSTLALSIFRLLEHTGAKISGSIELEGAELLTKTEREMRAIRGMRMSLIPQSPVSALNPALRLRRQIHEAWRAHADDLTSCLSGFVRCCQRRHFPTRNRFSIDILPRLVSGKHSDS